MKKIIIALLLLSTVLFIPSCAKESESEPKLESKSEVETNTAITKKTVRIGNTFDDQGLSEQIKAFNAESELYTAEFVQYADTNALNLDIASGDAPDVICFSGDGEKSSPEYLDVSYFLDMYPLIDEDDRYSREDFLPNVLECMETDGHLYRMSPTFAIDTVIAVDGTEHVKDGWTIDDFIQAMGNVSPEEIFPNYSSSSVTENARIYVRLSSLVDYSTLKSEFTCPEYLDYLNKFKTQHPKLPENDNIGFVLNQEVQGAVFKPITIYGFSEFLILDHGEYAEKPFSFVGYPSLQNIGGSWIFPMKNYGIIKYSENVEGAWDFVTYMLEQSYNNELDDSLSILTKIFNERAEATTKERNVEYVIDGEKKNLSWVYFPESNSTSNYVPIDPFTTEECEKYKDFVFSIHQRDYTDYHIQEIWTEEMSKFFSDECTAEEAAELVESRVAIYLAEQYG